MLSRTQGSYREIELVVLPSQALNQATPCVHANMMFGLMRDALLNLWAVSIEDVLRKNWNSLSCVSPAYLNNTAYIVREQAAE